MLWNNGELDIKPEQCIQRADTIHVDGGKTANERAATVDISQGSSTSVEFGKETLMVNASIMNVRYDPRNGPWLVDMDLERTS